MEIYVKISFISIFSLFFCFSNMILSDALILPQSQLQTQEVMVTNQVTHRIFNACLLYSCAHFVVKFDEKFSLNDCFKNNLMMILDKWLTFWATCRLSLHAWCNCHKIFPGVLYTNCIISSFKHTLYFLYSKQRGTLHYETF